MKTKSPKMTKAEKLQAQMTFIDVEIQEALKHLKALRAERDYIEIQLLIENNEEGIFN